MEGEPLELKSRGETRGRVELKTAGQKAIGRGLSNALLGTHKQRLEEKKTIIIEYKPGEKPDVTFTGFWTGKFIKAAMNSIARAYRLRRYRPSRPNRVETRPLKGGN